MPTCGDLKEQECQCEKMTKKQAGAMAWKQMRKNRMTPWKEMLLMEYNFKDRHALYIFVILEKWLVKEEIAESE